MGLSKIFSTLFFLSVLISLGSVYAVEEEVVSVDTSAQSYVQNCSGCHTIGGGELTGPDLADVASWTQDDLFPAVKKMEKDVGPLTNEEIQALVDFLKSPDARERIQEEEEKAAMKLMAQMEPPDSELGSQLFLGQKSFKNKGLACVSCHGISDYYGGFLGPDLSNTYSKMGETALISANEKTSFKIMKPAYKNHPITKQEAIHLTEFMKKISEEPKKAPGFNPVVWGGLGLAFLFLVGLMFMSPKAKKSTRKNLIKKKKKG